MIENDIIAFMKNDVTLYGLLGASGTDSRIYPQVPPTQVNYPYILYQWGAGDNTDEIINEDRIQFSIRMLPSNTVPNAVSRLNSIRDRMIAIMDKQDEIQATTITSTSYWIYYCKFTAGDTFLDPTTQVYNCIMFFNIKYKIKF